MTNKVSIALCFLVSTLIAGTIGYTPIPAHFSVEWFSQRVDHFSYANTDTFKQRYIISKDHWNPNGGPIFFYAGNEGDIFMFANNTGFMWESAQEFGAMVVFAEHRYYGQSMPYGNASYSGLNNLGYMTVEQALADFAELISYLRLSIDGAEKSASIVFGGSYGGMLATWFRMKYPHVVQGALASSAPVLQFPGIYKCNGYYDVITKDFEGYSTNCSQSIRNSWPALRRVGQTSEGRSWLTKTFALCAPLNETQVLVDWLLNTYGNLAMVDYPNPASFLAPLPAYPIREVCKKLTNPDQDDRALIQDIAAGVAVFTNYTGEATCNDIDPDAEESSGLDNRGWDFQSCTEMVMPICSDGKTTMFEAMPWDLDEMREGCKQRWGVEPEANKAEVMFGGLDLSGASNIIFTNGLRDPWMPGGVLKTLSESLIAIKIPHACHHEDLRPQGPNDPQILLTVRQQIKNILRKWIAAYNEQMNLV